MEELTYVGVVLDQKTVSGNERSEGKDGLAAISKRRCPGEPWVALDQRPSSVEQSSVSSPSGVQEEGSGAEGVRRHAGVRAVQAVRLDDVNPGLDAMDDAKEKGSSGGTLQRRWWWKLVSCS